MKQSTDYTIIELIRGVRMRRAGVLLKTKQYAVQEVAEMVGYNDIPTFRKHLWMHLVRLLLRMNKKMTTFAVENPKMRNRRAKVFYLFGL